MNISPVIVEFFSNFKNPVLVTILPLLIALIVTRFSRINLRNFTALYFIAGAGHVAIAYTLFGMQGVLWAGISLISGMILMLLAVGCIGKTQSAANYETLLAGVGLFPWYLSWNTSLVYLSIALLGIALIYVVRIYASRKKFFQPLKNILSKNGNIPAALHQDIWQEIRKALLPTPVAVAGLCALVFMLFF